MLGSAGAFRALGARLRKLDTLQVIVVPVEGELHGLVLEVLDRQVEGRLVVMGDQIELQGLYLLTEGDGRRPPIRVILLERAAAASVIQLAREE